jgi:hypothetical protein
MKLPSLLFVVVALSWSMSGQAQHAVAPPIEAPAAEARQFDFLLGQFELEVTPKINSVVAMIHGTPKLVGTWRAWKVFDGRGIEDELRIVDANGNPVSMNRSMRIYIAAEQRWRITGADGYRGRVTDATARFRDGRMQTEGRTVEAQDKIMLTRSRFLDVGPNGFTLVQDRSDDGGKTWEEGSVTIKATRTAATASP